ncbi:hypothetical protein SEVIR_8G025401v4 [Setaria viridis]|uniref:Uncharacterized protein n=1 Tax=Setaria viridis TaxID=4556 RepID=A0A4U6TDU7_SETVI|nr:hypothetical protein SEVIR_8G025401v2 [Setaria viridis]
MLIPSLSSLPWHNFLLACAVCNYCCLISGFSCDGCIFNTSSLYSSFYMWFVLITNRDEFCCDLSTVDWIFFVPV